MILDNILTIDASNIKLKIIDFISPILKQRNIEGIVVSYNDCVESLINVLIAKEIVGSDNVKLLMTKGRSIYKTPKEKISREEINRYINIPEENIIIINKEGTLGEIRKIFYAAPKFYDTSSVLNYNLSYYLLKSMVSKEIEEKTYEPLIKKSGSEREKFIQKTIAYHKSQIRLGMLLAFLLAETENKSLIGSINKTERLLGFFTKFGTYHAADFLPLADLYRTQVIQLAEYFKLQDYLKTQASKIPSSYNFFFGLNYTEVDRILNGLEAGCSIQEIFKKTNLALEAIEKVNFYYKASQYARDVPIIPKL